MIPAELFARVQRRLKQQSFHSGRTNQGRALASLILCGFDGVALQCQTPNVTLSAGVREKYDVWRCVPRECTDCDHLLPNIRDDILIAYIGKVLAPFIEIELQSRTDAAREDSKLDELQLALHKMEQDLIRLDGLAATSWQDDPMYAYNLRKRHLAQKRALEEEIRLLSSPSDTAGQILPSVRQMDSADPRLRADAIRSIIKWAAVLPSGKPKVRWDTTGEPARHPDQGRILFALPNGLYHTAVICFGEDHPKGYRKRINMLRPADPHECLGNVGDLPDPQKFVDTMRATRFRRGEIGRAHV